MVGSCMEENDKRVRKHVKKLIDLLFVTKGGEQRELLKIIYQMKISNSLEGLLFDHCIVMWMDIKQQSSVRFYAFKMLCKIAEEHPDLNKEVLGLLNLPHAGSLTPAIRKSVMKLAKELEKNNI